MKNQKDKISEHPNVKNTRVPPHNHEAEKALIGSILLDDQPELKVGELSVDDFNSQNNQAVIGAMQTLSANNKPIDLVTLLEQLALDGQKEKVGGLAYLSSLMESVPTSDNYNHYKDIVKKASLLRRLLAVSGKIADNCYAGDPTDSALSTAEKMVFDLSAVEDKSSFLSIGEATLAAIGKLELIQQDKKALRGIPTPFKGLNYLLGGLQNSDLILIAARPGQGKTSIGMNLISHAALSKDRKSGSGSYDPFKCVVFSLEMPAEQLAKRMLCSVARVDMQKANSGELDTREWSDLHTARGKLSNAKIWIDDNSMTTPIEILSKCRRLKKQSGLDLVMIDYLQLMSSGKRVESRQQEISEITRTLKIAAKELNVPILLLSQMSREVEKRTDKRPQMSDLRESGAIEQDADIIIFIYRKHDANDMTVEETVRNSVELYIAKHRNGSTGIVNVQWRGSNVSFIDVDNASFNANLKTNTSQATNKNQTNNNASQVVNNGHIGQLLEPLLEDGNQGVDMKDIYDGLNKMSNHDDEVDS